MKRGYYREDGMKVLVEILSDVTEEDGGRRVRLRSLYVERPSRLIRTPPPGDEWECWAAKGVGPYCGWDLEPLEI